MPDSVIFVLIFAGFFVLRGIAATVVFFYILPEGDRCLNCDAVTVRLQSRVWSLLVPQLRPSWCYECGWHGMLRRGPLTPVVQPHELTKRP